jgi:hypothetical protein
MLKFAKCITARVKRARGREAPAGAEGTARDTGDILTNEKSNEGRDKRRLWGNIRAHQEKRFYPVP